MGWAGANPARTQGPALHGRVQREEFVASGPNWTRTRRTLVPNESFSFVFLFFFIFLRAAWIGDR